MRRFLILLCIAFITNLSYCAQNVIAYLPYWVTVKNINQENLKYITHLVYVGYEIEGRKTGINGKETWQILSQQMANNTKLFLSLSCMGRRTIHQFLTSESRQDSALNQVVELLKLGKGDGVNIDFEGVPTYLGAHFQKFIEKLKAKLTVGGYETILNLPASDVEGIFVSSPSFWNKQVDLFALMGYDYNETSLNNHAFCANSPLNLPGKKDYSLVRSVNTYLDSGFVKEKLCLILPLYGKVYEKKRKYKFLENNTLNDIFKDIKEASLKPQLDSLTMTKFVNYKHKEIWFDDRETLGKKFAYFAQQGIGGGGLWALGYARDIVAFSMFSKLSFPHGRSAQVQGSKELTVISDKAGKVLTRVESTGATSLDSAKVATQKVKSYIKGVLPEVGNVGRQSHSVLLIISLVGLLLYLLVIVGLFLFMDLRCFFLDRPHLSFFSFCLLFFIVVSLLYALNVYVFNVFIVLLFVGGLGVLYGLIHYIISAHR